MIDAAAGAAVRATSWMRRSILKTIAWPQAIRNLLVRPISAWVIFFPRGGLVHTRPLLYEPVKKTPQPRAMHCCFGCQLADGPRHFPAAESKKIVAVILARARDAPGLRDLPSPTRSRCSQVRDRGVRCCSVQVLFVTMSCHNKLLVHLFREPKLVWKCLA